VADDPVVTNALLADTLAEIADLLEIRGDSAFRVGAYRRAAGSVALSPVDVAAAIRAGETPRLRGVGAGIGDLLAEMSRTGRSTYHDELRAELPPSLRRLLAIPGLGPGTVRLIWEGLGIATLEELEVAARQGRLRALRGLSARTEQRILAGVAELARRPGRRWRLADARALARGIVAFVETLPGVRSATACGSLRRWCDTVGDLDLLVETTQPESVLAAVARQAFVVDEAAERRDAPHRRASFGLRDGPQLDVMTMPPGVAGSYLVHFTGSAEHNVALRQRARELGWSLSEHGLAPLEGPAAGPPPRTFATEAELYGALGLDEIPPELREGRGEVEAAAQGRLPRLVCLADLQGDCHSHSDWSDGREPLEVMAASARSAGRRYQVLTDHSWSLGIANGLSPQRVEQQRRVIADLNERYAHEAAVGDLPPGAHPDGFRLLHGCELEITVDGRLDYEDALLARFDVVVASLHVGRRQPRDQLMRRYERALRSQHVDVISHPSGRKIGQRPDLDLDWEAFYRLAAETGTLLEVNGSEERLDLEPVRIRAALDAGCGFVISSDAHDRAEWEHLVLGTAMARRGWLEPRHVANTLPLEAFLQLMDEKPHRWPA
jgi:DNA polymerase (family 10)